MMVLADTLILEPLSPVKFVDSTEEEEEDEDENDKEICKVKFSKRMRLY